MGSSTWRLIQTKVLSSSSSFLSKSFCGISSSLATCLSLALTSGSSRSTSSGNRPDAGRHHAGGQQQPVAVEDAAAVGRQLQRAREAHLALALEEVVADHLHVGGAAGQHQEAERDAGHDELAAPDRRLAGEQRAGGVAHAAAAAHRAPRCARARRGRSAAGAGAPPPGSRCRRPHVLRDGRRGGAHLQLLLGQLLHAQRRRLRALFDLQALVLDLQPARLVLRPVSSV